MHAQSRLARPASSPDILGVDIAVKTNVSVKTLETDESYSMWIGAPRISIEAPTVFGAMYALETLSQLVDDSGNINGISITDAPRFAFRATMIDTARHWYPLEAIKQHLDAMSYVKMNVLHWHVVDSQSFPFVPSSLPTMSADGAYTPTHVYTYDDVREVVKYAMERGIRVVPEFDTPGHVSLGWQSLGVLTQCYDTSGKPISGRGAFGPLNPTLNKTYDVLAKLYSDVLAAFYPETFVHVGGDEVSKDCWQSNPQVAAWMRAHPEVAGFAGLETTFEQRLLDMLHAKGASYAVWQEIFDNGAKLPADTVIDVWKGGNWQDEMA